MGKSYKIKGDLADAVEMVYLIQTLKDIADSKFYALINQKYKFRRFGESFVDFFRMISLSEARHPLVSNTNPKLAVLAITIDGSFLGPFNNRIISQAIALKEKHNDVVFMGVGEKSRERLSKAMGKDIKRFDPVEIDSLYPLALQIKEYLVDEVMAGRIGKVMVCYSWPKSFEVQQSRTIQLLPCEDLVTKQSQFVDEFENVIMESKSEQIVGFLANLWITTRLFEMLMDTIIASAAAQASFLEDAVDRMKKERNKVKTIFLKAKKGDIDKSLRETFSARMIAMK
jgi:F0F1-type ATP synthase gamma subunit